MGIAANWFGESLSLRWLLQPKNRISLTMSIPKQTCLTSCTQRCCVMICVTTCAFMPWIYPTFIYQFNQSTLWATDTRCAARPSWWNLYWITHSCSPDQVFFASRPGFTAHTSVFTPSKHKHTACWFTSGFSHSFLQKKGFSFRPSSQSCWHAAALNLVHCDYFFFYGWFFLFCINAFLLDCKCLRGQLQENFVNLLNVWSRVFQILTHSYSCTVESCSFF